MYYYSEELVDDGSAVVETVIKGVGGSVEAVVTQLKTVGAGPALTFAV